MTSLINDAKQWLSRALEAREIAKMITDEFGKKRMLKIAEGYEQLAKRAEKRKLVEETP